MRRLLAFGFAALGVVLISVAGITALALYGTTEDVIKTVVGVGVTCLVAAFVIVTFPD